MTFSFEVRSYSRITGQPVFVHSKRVDPPAVRRGEFGCLKAHAEQGLKVLLEKGFDGFLDGVGRASEFVDLARGGAEQLDFVHPAAPRSRSRVAASRAAIFVNCSISASKSSSISAAMTFGS